MDSFELNKIFGAILGTLVFVMGVGFLAEAIYAPIEGRGATYELPEPAGDEGEEAAAEPQVEPIAVRMQSASAEAGANLINRCQSCHDYSSSNENRTGPGLWSVVERPVAAHEGFDYSDALASLSDQTWTYENLDHFIESPRNFAPGTKMTFAGLSDPQDRADLIAFLREQADEVVALPEAPAPEEADAEPGASEPVDEAAAAQEEQDAEAEAQAGQSEGAETVSEDAAAESEEMQSEPEATEPEGAAAPAEDEAESTQDDAAPAEGDQAAAEGSDSELVALVDSVDPAAGESIAARCQGCHDLSEANTNRVGPGLYDVFDRQIGGHPDYAYSDALAGLGEEGETWTVENLDAFIAGPSDFAPGTKMTFAGIGDETQRAELIAYLRALGN